MKILCLNFIFLFVVFGENQVIAKESCTDVYASAVRNVSVAVRQSLEFDYIYTQHCSESGYLVQTSNSDDLTLVAKKVSFGFNGSKEEARTTVEKFCKEHRGKNLSTNQTYSLQNEVVVDALRLLNQCQALQINEVDVWHQVQEPYSVIIGVDFNPTRTNLFLRSLTYENSDGACQTTGLSDDGKPVVVDESMQETKMSKPFSILCKRKPENTDNTNSVHFRRFIVGLDTNYGAYTVVLPADEVSGFDLASLNKQRYEELSNNLSKKNQELEQQEKRYEALVTYLRDQINSWQQKYNATDVVDQVLIEAGEYNLKVAPVGIRFDPRDTNITDQAASFCANKGSPRIKHVHTRSGDCCGYNYWIVSCIKEK